MDIQKLRDSKLIVDKVEEALQAAYSSNEEFNAVLDEADPLSFKSLRDPEHEYLVKVLQLKIRPLWYAAPADADGKPDHSLLEQILELAIAMSRKQVVFA